MATEPVRQHSAGLGEEGGRSERGNDILLFLTSIGSGRVYCRKRKVGRQGRGGEGWGKGLVEGQQGACPITSCG